MKKITLKLNQPHLGLYAYVLIFILIPLSGICQDGNWKYFNEENSSLPSNYINTIAQDKSGNIWIGTYPTLGIDDSLSNADHVKILGHLVEVETSPYTIGISGSAKFDGTNWTAFGLEKMRLPNGKLSIGFSGIYEIAFDELNKEVWFASYKGLINYNGTDFKLFNKKNSDLEGSLIGSVVVDKMGVKWLSGNTGGLVKYDGKDWSIYNKKNSGLLSNKVGKIMLLNDDLWISSGRSLVKYDGKDWVVHDKKITGASKLITSGLTDEKGLMWFGSSKGLTKFDGSGWNTFNTLNSKLKNANVSVIDIDNAGVIWVASKCYSTVTSSQVGTSTTQVGQAYPASITSFDGTNWTEIDLNYIYDRIEEYFLKNHLNLAIFLVQGQDNTLLINLTINDLLIDDKGNMWIATNLGLYVYNQNDVNLSR